MRRKFGACLGGTLLCCLSAVLRVPPDPPLFLPASKNVWIFMLLHAAVALHQAYSSPTRTHPSQI